ncbi:hypothetical protein BCR44DRAFT_1431529 [Catenaria anguillulae PL171]|uniref:Uncharacterized protein n=1 Tax=Catenaria anguillulae PL171 TaxID=765915 RepID=A0A1Y2HT77_9FUNG|nr:hypothetical protein BCR44DRAFT_1431529 [Catenaria anguillulae PL171]
MQLPLSPPRPPVLDAHPTSPTPMDSPARTSGRGRRVSIGHMAQDKQADAHGVGAPANAKAADVVELPVSQSQTSAQGPAASQAATASKTSLSSQPRSRSSGPTRPKTAAPPARLASPAKPIPSMSPEMDSPVRSSPRRARSRSSLSAASATSSLSHIRHRDPLAAATPAPAPATKLLDLARDPSLKPSRADLNPVLLEYVRQARANMPADDRRLVNLPAALANVFANAAREKARATFAGTVALMFRPESEFKKMVEEEAERERLRLAQRT